MGVAENGSGRNGELILAERALLKKTIRRRLCDAIRIGLHLPLEDELGDLVEVTAEAADAIRPAGHFKVSVASFLRSKSLCSFYQMGADSVCFACHG
jgi:hypothetical protein